MCDTNMGIIKYIIIIAVILGAVYFSQEALPGNMQEFMSGAGGQAGQYLAKGYSWAKDALFSKIGGGVEQAKEGISSQIEGQIEKQKENITQNISEKIKNYFSGVQNSILHPGTPQNCPDPAVAPASQP